MASRNLLVVTVVLLLSWAGQSRAVEHMFRQGENGYEGGHDLTIASMGTWPEQNPDRLRMYYYSDEIYNTLIRFEGLDELMSGKIVTSASITLMFQAEDLEWLPATIDIYPLLKPWHDPNCDWDFANTGTNLAWDASGAQGSSDRGPLEYSIFMGERRGYPDYIQYEGEYEFQLKTETVQKWIDEPNSNYGVIMVMNPDAATDVTFSSNDDADVNKRPLLTIVTPDCWGYYEADLNKDCYVNLIDYAILAGEWLDDFLADMAPAGGDGIVNMRDFSLLASQWLEEATGEGILEADLFPDGIVDIYDLEILAGQWLDQKVLRADIAPTGGDRKVDLLDLQIIVDEWLKCSSLIDENCD